MFRFACCILYLHIKSAAMRACENFCKNSFYNYLHSSTTATPASGGAVATINKLHRFFTGDDHFLRAQLKPQKCKNTSSFWTWKLILVNAISLIFSLLSFPYVSALLMLFLDWQQNYRSKGATCNIYRSNTSFPTLTQ